MSKQINDRKARDWEEDDNDRRYRIPKTNITDNYESYDKFPLRESKGFKSKKKYPKHSWCKRYLISKIGYSEDEIYSDLKNKFTKDNEFNYPNYILKYVWANTIKENNKIYTIYGRWKTYMKYEIPNNIFYWDEQEKLQRYKRKE